MQERRIVTALFADVVGFTALAEAYDPEDVATIQSAYFDAVRVALERYGGVLEKFIGDAAVAIFGIPRSREDDAGRAVRAALALHRSVDGVAVDLGLPPGTLALRVGVNTGEVAYDPQAPETPEGRVTGDTVNVAARLQAAAAPGGVLVGPETALAVAGVAALEAVEPLALKGKAEDLRAFAVQELLPQPSREAALGRLRAPMVGRDTELRILTDALDAVAGGGARSVVVVAPPGAGKTRLVRELADAARARPDTQVWHVSCRDRGGAPFEPVAELLLEGLRRTGPIGRLGDPGLPETVRRRLQRVLGAAGTPAADDLAAAAAAIVAGELDGADRDARFSTWLAALGALEGDEVCVWVVEDAHDASGDVLAFLRAAASRTGRRRLVLVTTRPAGLEAVAPDRDGGSPPAPEVVELAPLIGSATRELLHALVGDGLPEELVERVVDRADGNPLFVEELLRTWLALGVLEHRGDAVALLRPPDELHLPTTIRSLFASQLDDLPRSGRRVAQRGAVAGHTFPLAALRAMDVRDLDEGLERLQASALVRGPLEDRLGEAYAYRHALLADTAYATLSRTERADLHVRVADWLVDAGGDEHAELVAHHYRSALGGVTALTRTVGGRDLAELRELVLAWHLRASEAALRSSARDAARVQAEAARELAPAGSLAMAESLRLLGTAMAPDGLDAGAALLEEALALYTELLDAEPAHPQTSRGYALAVARLADLRFEQIAFPTAVTLLDEAMPRLGGADPLHRARVEVARVRATAAIDHRQATASGGDRVIAAARAAAAAAGDASLELAALEAQLEVGADAPEPILRRLEELAREQGDWTMLLRARRGLGSLLVEHDAAAAAAAVAGLPAMAETFGTADAEPFAWYTVAEVGLADGDWDGATEAGLRALELAGLRQAHRAAIRTVIALAPVAAARRDDGLLGTLRTWMEEQRDVLPPPSAYGRLCHRGIDTALGLSTPADLRPSVEDLSSDAVGHPSYLASREAVVRSWLDDGRREDVEAVVSGLRGSAELRAEGVGLSLASVSLIAAWLARAEEDAPATTVAARTALASARACRAPWWILRSLGVLVEVGEAASSERDEVVELERRLGVSPAGSGRSA